MRATWQKDAFAWRPRFASVQKEEAKATINGDQILGRSAVECASLPPKRNAAMAAAERIYQRMGVGSCMLTPRQTLYSNSQLWPFWDGQQNDHEDDEVASGEPPMLLPVVASGGQSKHAQDGCISMYCDVCVL